MGEFQSAFITASPVLHVISWQYCVVEVGRSKSGAASNSNATEMGAEGTVVVGIGILFFGVKLLGSVGGILHQCRRRCH